MFQKIKLAPILAALFFSFLISAPLDAQAASSCTPSVKIQDTDESYIKLKVTCASMKSTKVSMKILVSNNDMGTDSYKKATATLGKKGTVNLKISGLDSATNYSFKVKIKKSSTKTYSSYSSNIEGATEGSDYEPAIDKISSITEDSAKINLSCDDLDDETVDIQIAYKKKTSWSVKTFSLTLDGDSEGSFTLDGLKADTLYSFKIRIKKTGDTSYSQYSSVKTATTDED